MSQLEVYNQIFMDVLDLKADELNSDCTVKNIEAWTSISHIDLISAIEDAFDIMFDTDDIIDFSSYETGKNILTHYGIQI